MKTFTTRSVAALAAVCVLGFGLAFRAPAEERQFTEANCAITLPADWHTLTNLQPQPGVLGGYADASNKRVVVVVADTKNKSAGPIDERFVKSFEQGFENKAGGVRISGRFTEVAGLRAYERVGTVPVNGKPICTITKVVLADGACYTLQGLRFDGDVREDQATLAVLDTFRFLRPPAQGRAEVSAAYRLGYVAGRVAFFVMLGIGVCVLIGVIIWRNKKASPPPVPPGA